VPHASAKMLAWKVAPVRERHTRRGCRLRIQSFSLHAFCQRRAADLPLSHKFNAAQGRTALPAGRLSLWQLGNGSRLLVQNCCQVAKHMRRTVPPNAAFRALMLRRIQKQATGHRILQRATTPLLRCSCTRCDTEDLCRQVLASAKLSVHFKCLCQPKGFELRTASWRRQSFAWRQFTKGCFETYQLVMPIVIRATGTVQPESLI